MNTIWEVENGPILFEPEVHKDERGYFFESFNIVDFMAATGFNEKDIIFCQDNQSKSTYGTLRGMHAQAGEHCQSKIVSVAKGAVIDVIVDARKDSKNYAKVYSALLTEENHRSLFVPRGFFHGFLTLSDEAVFQYKCGELYDKASEVSVRWDTINFDWGQYINLNDIILSDKDKNAQPFYHENFHFDSKFVF